MARANICPGNIRVECHWLALLLSFGAQFSKGKLPAIAAIGGCPCRGKLLVQPLPPPPPPFHHHFTIHPHYITTTNDHHRSAERDQIMPKLLDCSASLTPCLLPWVFRQRLQLRLPARLLLADDLFGLLFWVVEWEWAKSTRFHKPFPPLPPRQPKCNESAVSGA